MRKVFLDDLPRRIYRGKNHIDWNKSVGCKVKAIYDDMEVWLIIVDYKDGYLHIKYLDESIFKIWTSTFTESRVGRILGKYTKEFKAKIGNTFNDKSRDLTITNKEYRQRIRNDNRKENQKWYKYTCNKCGWTEGWIEESSLLKGTGCVCCSGHTVVIGINDIPTTAPWMVKYFQGGYDEAKLYNRSSNLKVYLICPDCGKVKENPMALNSLSNTHSMSCNCSDKISYPNKFAYSLLDQLNEVYKFDYIEREYSPTWIDRKSYDNYFIYNGKEYILEMDGGWHNKDNNMSGQTKEESISIDSYKDKLAKEHNIEVIRINCEKSDLEFIKQNTIMKLNGMFNLSVINWNKCEEYALSNRVKECCNYWNQGIHNTKEIAKIMKMNRGTAIRYLKRGNGIWCDYDTKEEKKKGSIKAGKLNGKQVEIFKDGISLGRFPSFSELERQSKKLFGVELFHESISLVCTGRRKQHKGFTFKYINKIEQAI